MLKAIWGRHKYRALGVKEVPVTKVGGQIGSLVLDLNGIYLPPLMINNLPRILFP